MKVGKINLKISYPELRGSLDAMKYPAFVEPKYDGELNIWNGKNLVNKYGKTRSDFPAVKNLPDISLIGELYWEEGKAGRLYDLLKHKEDDRLNFKVFDYIPLSTAEIPHAEFPHGTMPLVDRREFLLDKVPAISIIGCVLVQNKTEAMHAALEYIDQGFEGAVVKSLDSLYTVGPCSWVKIKNKDQNDYTVSMIDPNLERIEVLVPNISKHAYIRVGCKCPNKYKGTIEIGDKVTIEHQGVLASGSLRHPVFIGKVAAQHGAAKVITTGIDTAKVEIDGTE